MAFTAIGGRTPATTSRVVRPPALGLAGSKLTLYADPPDVDISIENFEQYALDRLKVLKELESAKLCNRREEDMPDKVQQLVRAHLQDVPRSSLLQRDQLSHYILRVAYCRTEELRKWLLQYEADLFRYRFKKLDAQEQVEFFNQARLPYTVISDEEFVELQSLLQQVALSLPEADAKEKATKIGTAEMRAFYKVPFEEVSELIAHRRVLLRHGYAYVNSQQLDSVVVMKFRAELSKALRSMAERYASFAGSESERLTPLVETLSERYLGEKYNGERSQRGEVPAAQIPALASRHFPLCMASMYQRLHEDHHLKHEGRMQLGLFLKSIGVPLDEALKFWRQEFAPRTSGDKFEKEYAYNVRHNYGKEGNKKDYTAHSCIKIIGTKVGPADAHGCPYKTMGEPQLRAVMQKMRIADRSISDAVSKAKAGHYQLACACAFEGLNKAPCDTGVNHPNQYFEESIKTEGGGLAAGAEGGAPGTPAAAGAAGSGGDTEMAEAGGQQQEQQQGAGSSGATTPAPLPRHLQTPKSGAAPSRLQSVSKA